MLFMVVETFRDAKAAYQRFREKGRMLPDGLSFVNSWVQTDVSRCFQLMECDGSRSLDQWTARWSDIIDFEFVPVVSSADAARLAEKL